jgi:peptidoglycan-N-acetylglucosamine deacetylase
MSGSRPPMFVQGSIALHLFAAGAVTTQPSWWPMALAAVVADHAVIAAAGLWPTSSLLGPNVQRLPESSVAQRQIALTIDDGPDPDVTPRVLDLLDEHGIRATFFCIGEKVRKHAALAREIVTRGHSIENHSNRHRHDFSLLGPRTLDREIEAAQRAISDAVGRAPRFFRAPAGLRNVFLQGSLERHALRLTSWTRRGFDTVRRDPRRVASRLTDGLAAGDILLVHDGHAARTDGGVPVIVEVLPIVARAIVERDLTAVTLATAIAS